ncbi:iron-sulfur cluster insertion protein ErpA [Magnetospira thiophila]
MSEQPTVTITDNAAKRIAQLIEMEGDRNMALRLSISGGGCAGFSYGFSLDKETHDDDVAFEHGGVRVLIDETSLGLLDGSEIDFVQDLMGASFQVKNPNATSTCGCGTSFGV